MPACFCGRDTETVATMETPCCQKLLCWDFCLEQHWDGAPFRCPYCGEILIVDGDTHDGFDPRNPLDPLDSDDARFGPDLVDTLFRIVPPGVLDAHRAIKDRAKEWMKANRPEGWTMNPPTLKAVPIEEDEDDA